MSRSRARSIVVAAVLLSSVAVGPVEPAQAAALGIALRAATGSIDNNTTTMVLTMPAGVVSGDVLIAQLAITGGTAVVITVPTGWTLIRRESSGTSITQALYQRVSPGSEPASYTWTFAVAARAAGGIAAYSGVDNTTPVDVSSGAASSSNGTSIAAPTVTTTIANDMLLGFFATGKNQVITPPAGMTERWDVTPGSAVQADETDVIKATAGATGAKTATVAGNASWVGQLVALRQACSGGSLTATPPSSVSFPATSLTGLDQTKTTTAVVSSSDMTGSNSGWNLTASASQFTKTGATLPANSVSITGVSVAAASGNCSLPTNSVTYPATLGSSAVKIYNAAANTGAGPVNLTITFQVILPANALNGAYASTFTFTVASGP